MKQKEKSVSAFSTLITGVATVHQSHIVCVWSNPKSQKQVWEGQNGFVGVILDSGLNYRAVSFGAMCFIDNNTAYNYENTISTYEWQDKTSTLSTVSE